ncbi:MAG: glycosyltransferase family 9 protein [Terriglobia bacterium]
MASPPRLPAALLPELSPGAGVLVIRLRSLGDTLLTTPALRALKQWRPDLRVSLLLYARFAPILAGNSDVDEVIELNPEGPAAPLRVGRLLAGLQQRRFAACFNLHGGTLSALLTRASGARHRLGFAHFRFRFAYTATAPEPGTVFGRDRLHCVEGQLALFYAAGLPPGEIPALQLFPQPGARASVAQKLAVRRVAPGSRYAVIHPVANFSTKEWPFERYAALAHLLEEEHGLVPVFICGRGEELKLAAVARAYGKAPAPISLPSKQRTAGLVRLESLTLPELVALIEGGVLFIGNDSGPAHIAAALGRPVVVLYGSSDSTVWRPWRTPHAVVQNYYPCNPCRGDRCYAFAEPECILSVSLEQVRAAVAGLLPAVPSTAAQSG